MGSNYRLTSSHESDTASSPPSELENSMEKGFPFRTAQPPVSPFPILNGFRWEQIYHPLMPHKSNTYLGTWKRARAFVTCAVRIQVETFINFLENILPGFLAWWCATCRNVFPRYHFSVSIARLNVRPLLVEKCDFQNLR